MDEEVLRLEQVKKASGLPGSTIYALGRKGEFPRPFKLSAKSSGWLASEVESWRQARIEASRKESKP